MLGGRETATLSLSPNYRQSETEGERINRPTISLSRVPRKIVGPHIECDRGQKQTEADPEQPGAMDLPPVAFAIRGRGGLVAVFAHLSGRPARFLMPSKA
jgi:hypothetical protein